MRRKNRLFILVVLLGIVLVVYYSQLNSLDLVEPVQSSSSGNGGCWSYYEGLTPGWLNDFYDVNQITPNPAKDVIELVTRIKIFFNCLQQVDGHNIQRFEGY